MEQKKKKARKYCSVFNCLNRNSDPNLTFFGFPRDTERRVKWLTLVDRLDLLEKKDINWLSHLICSAHFEESAFRMIKHIKDDAIPTKFLPNKTHQDSCLESQSKSQNTGEDMTTSSNEILKEGCRSETPSTSAGITEKDDTALSSDNEENASVGTQTEDFNTTEETSKSFIVETQKKRNLSNQKESQKRKDLDEEIESYYFGSWKKKSV